MGENDLGAYDGYIEEHFEGMVRELREFCSRPTLAGQRIGVEEGVTLVQGMLEPLGARTRVAPIGDAPPVVLAATHISTLEFVSLDDLTAHALDRPAGDQDR